MLKDVYPLYLNNKAVQPNTDLAVTHKFTGEVAFRTALATPDIIDEAIAGTVKRSAVFANLDNQVARLARKLPAGGDLGAMAAALGGGGGAALPLNEAGEEDLT